MWRFCLSGPGSEEERWQGGSGTCIHIFFILSLDYLAIYIFQVKFKGLVSKTIAVLRRRGNKPGLPPPRTPPLPRSHLHAGKCADLISVECFKWIIGSDRFIAVNFAIEWKNVWISAFKVLGKQLIHHITEIPVLHPHVQLNNVK